MGRVGQRHLDLQHETIELRLGQRERALMLDRVLRRHHHERLGQLVRHAGGGHLVLGHRLEQRRLHLGRRAVDLVDQHQRVEDRAFDIFERALVGPEYGGAGEIGRHQVGRALDACERRVQPLCEKLHGARLRQPGRALDEQVAGGEQADQQALGQQRAPDQAGFEEGLEILEALLDIQQVLFDGCTLDGVKSGLGPHVRFDSLARARWRGLNLVLECARHHWPRDGSLSTRSQAIGQIP